MCRRYHGWGGDLNIGFNLLQKNAFPISNCIFVKYIFGHIRNCHPKKTQVVHLMEQIPQKLPGIAQIPPSMIMMTTTSPNPNPPSWQWPKVNICDGGVHQEFMLIISEKNYFLYLAEISALFAFCCLIICIICILCIICIP